MGARGAHHIIAKNAKLVSSSPERLSWTRVDGPGEMPSLPSGWHGLESEGNLLGGVQKPGNCRWELRIHKCALMGCYLQN